MKKSIVALACSLCLVSAVNAGKEKKVKVVDTAKQELKELKQRIKTCVKFKGFLSDDHKEACKQDIAQLIALNTARTELLPVEEVTTTVEDVVADVVNM